MILWTKTLFWRCNDDDHHCLLLLKVLNTATICNAHSLTAMFKLLNSFQKWLSILIFFSSLLMQSSIKRWYHIIKTRKCDVHNEVDVYTIVMNFHTAMVNSAVNYLFSVFYVVCWVLSNRQVKTKDKIFLACHALRLVPKLSVICLFTRPLFNSLSLCLIFKTSASFNRQFALNNNI